jgi:sialate O-acetylesterase
VATGKIEGQIVALTAEGLKAPVAVRYAFAGFPKVNLVNGVDLPAYPFRTDAWKRP